MRGRKEDMKTMNKLYRTLLMTIALVMGVVNVQAQDTYPLTFKVDGTIISEKQVAVGTTITMPSVDVPTGHVIEWGWSPGTMPNYPVTIEGSIKKAKYNLIYMVDGSEYSSEQVEYGATIQAKQSKYWEHHTFVRWDNLPETMPANDVTVTGVYEITKYTITYTLDGETYSEVPTEYGSTIVTITPEIPQGKIFKGWNNVPETMPGYDIKITGNTVDIYTLTLSYNETQGTVTASKTTEIEKGNQITVTVNPLEGFEIASVEFRNADGSTPNNWGNYTVQFDESDVTCTVTFRQTGIVTYNVWNGTITGGNVTATPNTATAGEEVTLTLAPQSGYVLESISVTDGTNNIALSENYKFIMPASNVTVNATFVDGSALVEKHTLTINVDGEQTTKDVAVGATLADELPANPEKEGYSFDSWSGMPEDGLMPDDNLEVTATFTINTYHITYMVDGVQYGDVADVVYGADITAPADPTKDGYTFTGWDNLPETMPADNLTINALFDKILNIGENETVIWDGTPAIVHGTEENLFIKNTNSWVSSTDQGGILRIYADINNPSNWKLWTGGGNWDHPTFVNVPNADLRESSTFTGYNATKVCFEFEFNDVTKQNLLNHITSDGTAMSISFWGLTIYKVTYEPPVNVPKHTLTFMMDDQQTVIETMQVAEGAEIPAITPPTKTGYVFSSWANMPLSGNMPASDLTLVAVFTEATYTLTFKIGDEVYGEPTQLAYGATITAPTDVPERTGYTFSGWQNVPETMPAQDLTIIGYYTKEKTYEPLSVGSSKYNTFYSTQPLYFQGSESVKAFIAIQYSATEVKLRQVIGAVAANTPLVLKGDAANASANIEVVESGESYGNNLLVGVRQSTSISSSQKYVLVEKSGTVKFADTGNHAATVPANKAYLQAPAGANARQLTIIFEGGVTAIEAISTENDDVPAVFNLSGQQVKNPGKGLYIINGKKVIIK